jgi:hypothetical protein
MESTKGDPKVPGTSLYLFRETTFHPSLYMSRRVVPEEINEDTWYRVYSMQRNKER